MREPEPMEQIDYGIGYKGMLSPQQHTTVKVEGSAIAIALSILALGFSIASFVYMPRYADKSSQAAAAPASVRSQISERENRVWIDQVQTLRVDVDSLKKEIARDQSNHHHASAP